jgi:hypothetical protein
MRGARGKRLQASRSELLERPNAHLYETGRMRRTHLRGHKNILKRLLVHAGGFNLALLMRRLIGAGTPRGLRDRLKGVLDTLYGFILRIWAPSTGLDAIEAISSRSGSGDSPLAI